MLTRSSYMQSSGSGGLFSNLTTQKRGSGDAAAQARRESFSEMKPTTGFVGKMWNKYVDVRMLQLGEHMADRFDSFTAGSQNK